MKNHVVFTDGSVVELRDLSKWTSFTTIAFTPHYVRLCEFIARTHCDFPAGSDEYKTLVNLLYLKSYKVKAVAAVIMIARSKPIRSIHIDGVGPEFAEFFDYPVTFAAFDGNRQASWVNRNEALFAIVKTCFYRAFGVVSRFNPARDNGEYVARSWVDDAEGLYKKEFEYSVIFIYPFFVNIKRGVRFIRHCFATYPRVYLMGVPYSFLHAFKSVFVRGSAFDRLIVRFEVEAMRLHAPMFFGFKTLFTSDEFLVSSHVLHNILTANGIRVVNKAHGIGFYGPYVRASEMHMLNQNQIDHYRAASPEMPYDLLPAVGQGAVYSPAKEPAIVIVDQGDLTRHSLSYENDLQADVLRRATEVAQEIGVRLFIKFHPNRVDTEKAEIARRNPAVSVVTSVAELDRYNVLFLNLFSTSYFDWRRHGKFLFIETDQFKPAGMFGAEIRTTDLEHLRSAVEQSLRV